MQMILLYYLSLVFIRLPPFLLPFGITTHIVFRIINVILIFYLFFRKETIIGKKPLIIFSLIYFVSQAISIFAALNLQIYLYFFERLVSVFLFFMLTMYFLKKHPNSKKTFIRIIYVTAAINALIELTIFFNPQTVDFFYHFIHKDVLDILVFNINRGRLFFESYGEIFIPVFLYALFFEKKSNLNKTLLILLVIVVTLLAFWSNYRDRFLTAVFGFIGFIFVYAGEIKKIKFAKVILITACFFLAVIFGLIYINDKLGFSVINRLLLENQQDIETLYTREQLIGNAVAIGLTHPLIGVGLGNYYDHLPSSTKNKQYLLVGDGKTFYSATLLYPHNLFAQTFAETGILGIFSLLLLLGIFAKEDILTIRKNKSLKASLVVSFWLLIFYAMFNPRSPLQYFSLFFMLRALIEAYSIRSTTKS